MHAVAVAPVFDVSRRSDCFKHNGFSGSAKRQNQEDLVPIGDREGRAKLVPPESYRMKI